MKVLHIPARVSAEVVPVLKANIDSLKPYSAVGLAATAQHMHELEKAKEFLEERGKTVFLGGQLLGCDANSALNLSDRVDCFVFIGSGRFHALAIALETEKPVFIANPISNAFEPVGEDEKQRWLKRRKGRIAAAAAAETLGVLVSTKGGQFRLGEAMKVRERLKAAGKKVFLFAGDFLSPENLMSFKVGAWVNTACPRIVEDDHENPVVTMEEISEWLP